MHARERLIRQCFADQQCAHCSALYPAEGIVVLARRPNAWMVLASCDQCQRRGIFVVRFPARRLGNAETLPEAPHLLTDPLMPPLPDPSALTPPQPEESSHSPSPRRPRSESSSVPPITAHDVDAMHEFLRSFDGDFRGLFAHQRPGRTDETSGS